MVESFAQPSRKVERVAPSVGASVDDRRLNDAPLVFEGDDSTTPKGLMCHSDDGFVVPLAARSAIAVEAWAIPGSLSCLPPSWGR